MAPACGKQRAHSGLGVERQKKQMNARHAETGALIRLTSAIIRFSVFLRFLPFFERSPMIIGVGSSMMVSILLLNEAACFDTDAAEREG